MSTINQLYDLYLLCVKTQYIVQLSFKYAIYCVFASYLLKQYIFCNHAKTQYLQGFLQFYKMGIIRISMIVPYPLKYKIYFVFIIVLYFHAFQPFFQSKIALFLYNGFLLYNHTLP